MTGQSLTASVVCLLLLAASCSKQPSQKPAASADTLTTESKLMPRRRDQVYDDRFLIRQANRADFVRERIQELLAASPSDTAEIRRWLLKRKAELSGTRRDLYDTDRLTPAEKDSLAAPLDSEAIEIAEDLLDFDLQK